MSNGVPRGLRMTVYDVFSSLAAGMTHQDILTDFFYLTEDDIRPCLSYPADRERQMVTTGKRQVSVRGEWRQHRLGYPDPIP